MHLAQLFDSTIHFLVHFIGQIGYLGILLGMFLESTMFPLPSELIMIPAGIAVSYGKMDIYLVIFFGVLGNTRPENLIWIRFKNVNRRRVLA